MIFDQPNIAQILKKYLYDHHNKTGVGTNDLLSELGFDVMSEIDFEEFICDKFRLGNAYVDLRKIYTFGELVKHIYLMRFYRSIVQREMKTGVEFWALVGDGYTYEVFHKKPNVFKRLKEHISGKKFIFCDIVA